MLCKHEVVGSIPTGSTSLRRLRLLRLGKPECSEGCRAGAHLGVGGLFATVFKFVRETTFRIFWSSPGLQETACYLTS